MIWNEREPYAEFVMCPSKLSVNVKRIRERMQVLTRCRQQHAIKICAIGFNSVHFVIKWRWIRRDNEKYLSNNLSGWQDSNLFGGSYCCLSQIYDLSRFKRSKKILKGSIKFNFSQSLGSNSLPCRVAYKKTKKKNRN